MTLVKRLLTLGRGELIASARGHQIYRSGCERSFQFLADVAFVPSYDGVVESFEQAWRYFDIVLVGRAKKKLTEMPCIVHPSMESKAIKGTVMDMVMPVATS